uniref:C2 domain-containing protein n=1 Tax=Spermophilus dauricus TaxID=99837 RepID=A0A8C9QHV3_SPEDA
VPPPAPGRGGVQVDAEETGLAWKPSPQAEKEPPPPPAQVGGSGSRGVSSTQMLCPRWWLGKPPKKGRGPGGPLLTSGSRLPRPSYVKSYLLPDKQSKRKTAVKKRNLNPVFNEILRYSIPQAELSGRVLSLSVWHRESLGRNIFLGEVEVPLDTWNWDSEPTWLPLQPRVSQACAGRPTAQTLRRWPEPSPSAGAGLPESGELHFWVKEAQDLIPLRSGSLDTSVLPDDSRASRQRTRVVRRSLSPVFNHTMVYDGFGPADLRQACAELSLWDHGALTNRQLGGTRLSLGTGSSYGLQVPWMDSTPEEKQLWQTLLERPCEWVDGLLPLRTNLIVLSKC